MRKKLVALVLTTLAAIIAGSAAQAREAASHKSNLITVKVGMGPYYDYQFYTVASKLGIDQQFGIHLQLVPYPNWSVEVLKRGAVDIMDSCQMCAATTWAKFPAYRDFLISNQFRGFVLVGRAGKTRTYAQYINQYQGNKAKALPAFVRSLRGKTFTFWKQGNLSILESLLNQAGLTDKDVKIADFPDDNRSGLAFLRGVGDYYIGALPQVARMLYSPQFKGKYVAAATNDAFGPGGLWYSSFATTKDWLDKNHDTALRMIAIWYRATRYLYEKPSVALPIIEKAVATGAGAVFGNAMTQRILTRLNYFPTIEKAYPYLFGADSPSNQARSVSFLFGKAQKAGQIPKNLNWRSFENAGPLLKEVMARKDLMDIINAPLK